MQFAQIFDYRNPVPHASRQPQYIPNGLHDSDFSILKKFQSLELFFKDLFIPIFHNNTQEPLKTGLFYVQNQTVRVANIHPDTKMEQSLRIEQKLDYAQYSRMGTG